MKVNWKVRFRNRTWITTFICTVISLIYIILDLFGVIPEMSETAALHLATLVLTLLSLIGVVIDPTTEGIGDSERAQGYSVPWDDDLPEGGNG